MNRPKSIRTIGPSVRQLHAARVVLDWTQADLAKASKVGIATIKRLEHKHRDSDPAEILQFKTLAKLVSALEAAGVEFIFEDGRRGISFKG
jgi:transcriptional regulator with XRE-family HTH domain